jgi:PAS domain S-box-containing protein
MARILIVEDELVAAWSIQEFLERSEHIVVASVASGSAAIQIAAEAKPDLVVMDIYLEGEIDGITAATEIRERFGIPVIYLTANTEDQTLQRAIATEPFGYLVKPFNKVELYTTISIALQRYQLEQQLETTEQWLTTTLTSIGDGTIATDREGVITFMNPAAEDLTGWQQAEAVGEPATEVLNLIHSETREAIVNPLLEAIQAGAQVKVPEQCLLRTKHGIERAIGDTAAPIRNQKGEITGGVLIFQDITGRKQAEELAQQREQEFRALVENSPDAISRFDREMRYIYVNPAIERFFGIPAQSFIGKRNSEMEMPADLVALWDGTLQQALTTQQPQIVEFAYTSATGLYYYQTRIVPELAPDGTVASLLAVSRDITELKQAEITLQQQAHRERTLNRVIQTIRNSLDLNTIFDATAVELGTLLQVDRANILRYLPQQQVWLIVSAYNRSPETTPSYVGLELPDEGPIAAALKRLETIRLDDANVLEDEFNQVLAQTFPGAWLTVPLQVGGVIWGNISLVCHDQPFTWQDWQVDLTLAVADQLAIAIQQSQLYQQVQQLNADLEVQVQERTASLRQAFAFEATLKRITDRVRDSLDEAHILQTAVQELVLAIGVNTCNAALYDLEQHTSKIHYEYAVTAQQPFQSFTVFMSSFPEGYQQLLTRQYFQFCHLAEPPQTPQAKLACPMFDDQGVLGDLWLLNDADYYFTAEDIRLVQLVANQCAIAIRQSRLYQTAQAQVTELEQLNRLKDDFLSNVSHELRTPMSNIKMAIQMLEIVLNPLGLLEENQSVNRYFRILNNECQREISLVEDLLALSRLDTGTEPLVLTTIEPRSWLIRVVEPFVERIHNQQQRLEISIPADLPSLTADITGLERILAELLDNASKYSPTGATITVFARTVESSLQIGVRNTGVEISADELPRIFDKFYRIPNQDPWRYSGTGLGLALVQKLADHIGATIHVESADSQTTFTLTFSVV